MWLPVGGSSLSPETPKQAPHTAAPLPLSDYPDLPEQPGFLEQLHAQLQTETLDVAKPPPQNTGTKSQCKGKGNIPALATTPAHYWGHHGFCQARLVGVVWKQPPEGQEWKLGGGAAHRLEVWQGDGQGSGSRGSFFPRRGIVKSFWAPSR